MERNPYEHPTLPQRFRDRLKPKHQSAYAYTGVPDSYFTFVLPKLLQPFNNDYHAEYEGIMTVVRDQRADMEVDDNDIPPVAVTEQLLVAWANLMKRIYADQRVTYDRHIRYNFVAADLERLNAERLRKEVSQVEKASKSMKNVGRRLLGKEDRVDSMGGADSVSGENIVSGAGAQE